MPFRPSTLSARGCRSRSPSWRFRFRSDFRFIRSGDIRSRPNRYSGSDRFVAASHRQLQSIHHLSASVETVPPIRPRNLGLASLNESRSLLLLSLAPPLRQSARVISESHDALQSDKLGYQIGENTSPSAVPASSLFKTVTTNRVRH